MWVSLGQPVAVMNGDCTCNLPRFGKQYEEPRLTCYFGVLWLPALG